jgi:hypothetical protein
MKTCKSCIFCEGSVYGKSGCHDRVNKRYRCQLNEYVSKSIHANKLACNNFKQK